MIPKKIHFTWFSNDPYPELIQNCMKSWKEFLPDYEFIHWDMNRIADIDNCFLREALEKRKWAFAADFVRLYALYHEGGIYLDTDVEVFKSFDDLLKYEAFIGKENSFHVKNQRRAVRFLTSHCMGARKEHPFMKSCLDYYSDRHFILSHIEALPDTLKYDQTILPYIQFEIAKMFDYNPSDRISGIQTVKDGLTIFPVTYFDPLNITRKSYCLHLAMGSWRNREKNFNFSFAQKVKKKLIISASYALARMNIVAYRKL